MFNKTPTGAFCPLIGKACIESKCKFWIHVAGTDGNTGKQVDHFDCAVSWLPVLLINNAQEVRQGAAATESFRNEVVKRQDVLVKQNSLLPPTSYINSIEKLDEPK